VTARRANEDEKERQEREEEAERRREEDRQFVREVADAYNFHPTGIESLDAAKPT
jgi:predicted AAA+ superfamily ATPase